MKSILFLFCLLGPVAALAVDPNEGLITKFMTAWFPAMKDAEITLEAKESGPGFFLYYAKFGPKDKKGGDTQPLIYLPNKKTILVGDYFNLSKFKDQAVDMKFIGTFLSNAIGASTKAVELPSKPDLPEFDVAQETGYGKVHYKGWLFGKVHLLIGKAYAIDDDPRQLRMKEVNVKMGGALGDPAAPNKLYVFLDLECPFCAKLEKDLIPLLKERKDWQAVFFQFPLTIGHPISFKAAGAAHCFLAQNPRLYFDFMEWFYPQRADVDLSSIDSTCYGFAEMHGLEEPFLGCYMKEKNIQSVLDSMQMALDAGVRFTPTAYVNGSVYGPWDLMALLKPPAAAEGAPTTGEKKE